MSDVEKEALLSQLESLVKGAQEFKAQHGSCKVTVGPNAPVALAGIQQVSGFWINVERVTLTSLNGNEDDLVIDGPLVYYRAVEQDGVTATDVTRAVDWMGSMNDLRFDSVSWQHVEDDGEIYLEGRVGKRLVDATFVLREFNVQEDGDDDDEWGDDDE